MHRIMSKLDCNLLKNKFRGTLLGSLVGDCLGAPYEGDEMTSGTFIILQRYFDGLEQPNLKIPIKQYTDDTAMMKALGSTLISYPELDYTQLARAFVREYYNEPDRGYGQQVVKVFEKLRKNKFGNIYQPAAEQFEGKGSFGNGGAMRIAPLALRFYDNYEAMLEAARKQTLITHSNILGINGAILQCIALQQALKLNPSEELNRKQFCEKLREKMEAIECSGDDVDEFEPPTKLYSQKIGVIQELLELNSDELRDRVVDDLGNSISAQHSVPTAILCFLKAFEPLPNIKTDNIYRKTIQFAISLGGDTDTIACMAGALCGAYFGVDCINENFLKHCESFQEIQMIADDLFALKQ